MYSMPVVGTSARLYFPNESSEAPIVAGCVRKNGSDREKYPPFNDEPKTGQKTEKKQEKLLISFFGCPKKIF